MIWMSGMTSTICPGNLTYTKGEVEQPHPNVKTEEKDDIGYFAEHEDVSHMLIHSN